jgi:hypothetical protein
MGLGPEILDPEKNYSGSRSRIQGQAQIRDPDPLHCIKFFSNLLFIVLVSVAVLQERAGRRHPG